MDPDELWKWWLRGLWGGAQILDDLARRGPRPTDERIEQLDGLMRILQRVRAQARPDSEATT